MRGIGGFVLVWWRCGGSTRDRDVFVRVVPLRLWRSRDGRRKKGSIILPMS
jgi:hypothetical protein